MTLRVKLDFDMVKMYLHTQNEIPNCNEAKLMARTDAQMQLKLLPHADGKNELCKKTSNIYTELQKKVIWSESLLESEP